MILSAHALAIDTFVPMLRSLSHVLEKGAAHANATNVRVSLLVEARLAPDMFTLAQQAELACHHARDAISRLRGLETVRYTDVEKNIDGLVARIKSTVEELESLPAASFDGAFDRDIVIPLPDADVAFEMKGYQFLRDWSFPHFYFHVVTAYDILRHNGVDIGKRDYASHAARYIRPAKPR